MPRQNSIPAGDRVGSPYEYLRSKPQLSGRLEADVRSSKLRTSETHHIEDGGGGAVCRLGVRSISSGSPVVSMMQSTASIVRNNAPGVCGTNPPRRSSPSLVRGACGPRGDSEHSRREASSDGARSPQQCDPTTPVIKVLAKQQRAAAGRKTVGPKRHRVHKDTTGRSLRRAGISLLWPNIHMPRKQHPG